MSVIIPDCTSCENLKAQKENGQFCCAAFPNGIPEEYFWGNIPVRKIPECANDIKFEEIKD